METVVPEVVGLSSERLHRIDDLIQKYVDQGNMAGVVTVVARQGKIAHAACVGMRDTTTNTPMTFDTIFRIYSMTKPITSVALLMLFEQGLFQLDDPVALFIPELAQMPVWSAATEAGRDYAAQERPMTIRDLLTHTAGLPYDDPEGSPVEVRYHQADLSRSDRTLRDMVQQLATLPLAFQPGSAWQYGLATDVLGYLIEVLSGMSLDVFFKERIFAPLGMVDTGFYVPSEHLHRLARVYGPAADGGCMQVDTPGVNRYDRPRPFLDGGGGLVSTAHDYLRFVHMLLNGGHIEGVRLLGRKTVELMTRNHLPLHLLPYRMGSPELDHLTLGHGFGLGVRVLLDSTQIGFLGSEGEYGWAGAANTIFWVDPKEAMVCLFLTQFMPAGIHYPIERQFKVLAYQSIVD